MYGLFDLISCYMPKSENDVVFEVFFDNLQLGWFLKFSSLSFGHFSSLSHHYVHSTEINLNF